MRRKNLWGPVVLACVILLTPQRAMSNGGVHKTLSLTAEVTFGDSAQGHCVLRCEIAPVLYGVTTFAGRYRVLQITFDNRGRMPFPMSRSKDTLQLVYLGEQAQEVEVMLDLPAKEPEIWSELPFEVRSDLAYPLDIQAGEEETVFAFVPLDAPATPPDRMRFTLAGLSGRVVELHVRGITAD